MVPVHKDRSHILLFLVSVELYLITDTGSSSREVLGYGSFNLQQFKSHEFGVALVVVAGIDSGG